MVIEFVIGEKAARLMAPFPIVPDVPKPTVDPMSPVPLVPVAELNVTCVALSRVSLAVNEPVIPMSPVIGTALTLPRLAAKITAPNNVLLSATLALDVTHDWFMALSPQM